MTTKLTVVQEHDFFEVVATLVSLMRNERNAQSVISKLYRVFPEYTEEAIRDVIRPIVGKMVRDL